MFHAALMHSRARLGNAVKEDCFLRMVSILKFVLRFLPENGHSRKDCTYEK